MDDTSERGFNEYSGLPGRTRKEALHYTCSACGFLFGGAVHTAVNVASDPELGELLSKGELNLLTCPACQATCAPAIPLIYHDPKARCFALLLPEGMRHEELRARADVLRSLMDDPADIPAYVRRVDVVFGTAGLLRLLDETMDALSPQESEDPRARQARALAEKDQVLERREGELVAREEDLQAREEDLVSQRASLERGRQDLARAWVELEHEREALRSLALELRTKHEAAAAKREPAPAPGESALPAVPGAAASAPGAAASVPGAVAAAADAPPASAPTAPAPLPLDVTPPPEELAAPSTERRLTLEGRPQQEVDRWRASDERTAILRHEGRTFLLARPGATALDVFRVVEPELLLQLHRTVSGPVLALIALPAVAEGQARPQHMLTWTIDPAASAQRPILEALAEEFLVQLDLYDDESRPATTWEVQAPLAENMRLLLEHATKAVEETPAEMRDFADAVKAFEALGEERFGRKQHNFSSDAFRELPTPAATRLALGIVAYWSEPENQDYLLEVKSFPMTYWRAVRERVVRRAIEFGLRLSSELVDFVLEQKLSRGRKDLLRTLVANAAEVSLRIKASDLEPAQELENWKLLLADCMREEVKVDVEIEELFAAVAKRAGATEDETAPGGDLGLLSEEALVTLLSDRAQRRDAALELCDRGNPKLAEPIYRAMCNMTRGEVARVVPAMLPLGKEVVRHFVRGLKHRKSFVRQGCALGLGALRAEDGIAPLMEMLLSEPTNVWREAARSLGEMGTVALGALVAGVKTADPEGRERIGWALSQTALDESSRAEVEAMGKGRDTRLARVATRALELVDQVRHNDQEVRGQRPMRDQTLVRSFTRQFFDAMSGEVRELGEADIVDQEEVLDDNDIVDEAVVVHEDDIIDRQTGRGE